MSRTYKDKPYRFQYPSWDADYIWLEGYGHREAKTTKTKKRKKEDTEDHWMTTPSWWVNMIMTKPERRNAHLLEKKALVAVDLEDFEIPDLGRKPYIYYW
jgi:hypothetical protein